MRVLFVIDSFHMGGAEKSLVTLLNLLPLQEMDVEVMRMAPDGQLEHLLPDRLKLSQVRMKGPGLIGQVRYLASRCMLYLSRRLSHHTVHPNDRFWRCMRHSVPHHTTTYDVAIAYQQGFPTAYVATRVNARRKIAWVNADVAGAGYNPAFNLPFYLHMHRIVTVSDTLRTLFVREHPTLAPRVTIVNDIIDPAAIRRLASAPSPYTTGTGTLRLLTVARLEHIKGIDIALHAARLLYEKKLDFHWHFIGDGNERTRLQTLIGTLGLSSHVTLHGTISNPYPWMLGCDIYVQPSRHEGYGIAIVEAMTLARPVIAADFPVAHDHIDGTNGIITPGTPEGLADAIISLTDTDRRNSISRLLSSHQTRSNSSLHEVLTMLRNC